MVDPVGLEPTSRKALIYENSVFNQFHHGSSTSTNSMLLSLLVSLVFFFELI